MSFAEKLITSQKKQIYKICERTESGKNVWFILHVPKHKIGALKSIPKGQSYSVTDYGTIIKWGYGNDVPQEILNEVKAS